MARSRSTSILAAIAACLAIGWILLRSAAKPSRLAYPCQQAALNAAFLVLGTFLAQRRGARTGARARVTLAATALAMIAISDRGPSLARITIAPSEYRARIWALSDAGGPQGDHHLGVDQLLACMDAGGQAFFRSATPGPERGTGGIVGAEDLVLIKINQQWDQRGGTNTDVLKGLILRILEHPDGFTGEVVVVENTQAYGTMNWSQSNAENHGQSAQDVIDHFAGLGHPVSGYLWDTIRNTLVGEYAAGDMADGYVVGALNPNTQGRVSYPKFRTAGGRYVSLKHGVWNPGSQTYSDAGLCFLNVPVLKCHGAVYGVTAAVKHHVGTMTTALSSNTHAAVRYGQLGAFLSEVRMPDLNILDCMYILAHPNLGPAAGYQDATAARKLLASQDPVALDIWAVKHVLVPAILANGYTTYPKQDPDNPASIFRIYLDASMSLLLAAGNDVTNDLSRIDALEMTAAEVPAPGAVRDPWLRVYPNPSTGAIRWSFDTPGAEELRLVLTSPDGRRVRTIAGRGPELVWDGRDDRGMRLPAGVYAYTVAIAGEKRTGTIILAR